MIKTIKVKKQMRLDELIKYAWDNQLNKIFVSDKGLKNIGITIDSIDLRCLDNGIVSRHDTFTVEVEEEITEDTVFQTLVAADSEGDACMMYQGTIDEIQDSITTEIYANINGKLQLIWEVE